MKKIFKLSFLLIFLFSLNAYPQWVKTSGPPGMNVNVFYQKGSSLYAGTSAKGVFKSADHSITWSVANTGIENKNVFSLVADGNNLYAGTNDGVYRSTNMGASWSPANNGIQGQFIYSFLVANGYLFAGTISFGVFKSNDHGNTWTNANGGALGSSSIYAMCFSSPNIIAMADNLIFYSTNNGNSWFIPQNSPFLFSIATSFIVQHDSVMINTLQGVFRSFDAGQSWDPIIVIDESVSFCGLVKSKKTIFAGSATRIFKSKDFGTTWSAVNVHDLRIGARFVNDFYKSGNNFLLANDEIGVAYSSDACKHWTYTLSGFPPASSIDNALCASGSTLFSGTHSDGVYQTTDNGTTWSKIGTTNNADTLSNGTVFSVLKISSNILLAGTCGFGLYRSADNGATWVHITTGLPLQAGTGFLCVNSLAQSSSNILIATDQGLYYSTDNGLTWHSSNTTGTSKFAAGVAANGSTACAVVNETTGSNKIYRSTNSGVSWSSVFSTVSEDFVCVASDGIDHFYVGTFTSNYLSANNGSSWQSFGSGIQSGTGSFAIAVKDSNVFVGNSTGVYFSHNKGSSFISTNTGLDPDPNNSVQGLAISSNFVFAGLFQNAIWKRPLSDFGISLKTNVNTVIELNAQIYPNPVTGESFLSYEVATFSPVKIAIYDEQGKMVNQVLNTNLEKGIYRESITSDYLTAGNYFISLSIGEKTGVIKFEVVK